MKILLLGKRGQVGWELQRSLSPLGQLIALDRYSEDYCGDLANLSGLTETIRVIKPDVIVNAAAYTAVDQAESEPELVRLINADAPDLLAQEAKRLGAWLIHYSTDYVFNGRGDLAWKETDITAPLNVYGETKLAGEQAIQASGCRHLIFRTSWVYGVRGNNFAKTMLRLAQTRESLTVINDQFGAPTGADLIADVTAHTLRRVQMSADLGGLYHLVASGETSWHGFARLVIDSAIERGYPLKIGGDEVEPVPTSAFPTSATRPNNSRLNTDKLQTHFSLTLPDWQTGVRRMLAEHLEESYDSA